MDLGLAGKTAIITGGSGGIGRGLLIEFAREGLNVVSASRDQKTGEGIAEEARAMGLAGTIVAVATDVTDRKSVDAMVAVAHERFGPVDVLINNAGGVAHPAPFEDFDEEGRRWEIALNIDGVVNCCQAVAQDMLGRQQGSIVNISSNASLLGEAANGTVNYGATKGYVNSFSKALAYEWANRNVRVNTIAPGWIVPYEDDQMGPGSFWNRFGKDVIGTPTAMVESMEQGTLHNISNLPLKRLGRPEDIAYAALFFASDRSSYMTGQLVSVGGGAWMF
ncbi:SDR family NAD(P)-dependent oxidoreductase [Flavisphingomonas formosensis]|uniref:SDR family NAD(P)-dependent oxidoreductase n=1 Tax=Flavisphingomonas formosensis TaxID=861534 RepID=UPI0012F7899E|nr:SDR family oxidoreductase [Sphingomonas formosensis]